MNPILGPDPSKVGLIAFGLGSIGVVYLVTQALSDPWRQLVVDSVIASEKFNIEENERVQTGWNADGGPPLWGRSMEAVPVVISFRF